MTNWTLFSKEKPSPTPGYQINYRSLQTKRLVSDKWAELNPNDVEWLLVKRAEAKKTDYVSRSLSIDQDLWESIPGVKNNFVVAAIGEKMERGANSLSFDIHKDAKNYSSATVKISKSLSKAQRKKELRRIFSELLKLEN